MHPNIAVHRTCKLTTPLAAQDTGGETWAEVWYLEERQPEIIVNNCEHAMASDPATGMVYWGHPGAVNMSRANYTVHQSSDGACVDQGCIDDVLAI